jgi:signal transduction histidine kinase
MAARRPKPQPEPPARRMIPATPEARISFLRMVSHELRTPLNSIIGFAEILNSQIHGPLGAAQYAEYAGIIRDSGYKMLKLVNQVLELIRLSEGMVRLDIQPSRVGFAAIDAIDLVRGEARDKGLTLTVEEPDIPPWALVDARALRGVLCNLMNNAVQFSPRGGRIGVRVFQAEDEVVIEVEDDGPGIASEDLGRVLHPFEQGEYALTRTTEGAGLGLPTARLLCEVMGGDLVLANRPDGGLRAMVTLIAAAPDEVVRGGARA